MDAPIAAEGAPAYIRSRLGPGPRRLREQPSLEEEVSSILRELSSTLKQYQEKAEADYYPFDDEPGHNNSDGCLWCARYDVCEHCGAPRCKEAPAEVLPLQLHQHLGGHLGAASLQGNHGSGTSHRGDDVAPRFPGMPTLNCPWSPVAAKVFSILQADAGQPHMAASSVLAIPSRIWCGFVQGKEPIPADPQQQHVYFRGHIHFTRWLFSQPRGQVIPHAILVSSWREARACVQAIRAAQTGLLVGLRDDEKRTPLHNVVGFVPPGTLPGIAVGSMIIIAESDQEKDRASRFASRRPLDNVRVDVCPVLCEVK